MPIPRTTGDRREKISPSEFMRELRPEYYSDTEDHVSYVLDTPVFEHHLESITQRNQTQDFEMFCRKLCERTICPNLRAHTGPDGGGDSKVDTETYPVTEEIAALFYIGEEKAAQERWAFAFSAKEDWKAKVKDDVKKISETARDYKRIIFVTSRPAKDKDRAGIEDALSEEYGIQVTIHDRSWIVKEIIENDRKDIAYNYLNVGEAKNDPLRLGPTDYSRARQLSEAEKSLEDSDAFKGMEQQRVTEALIAAKLSRNLERPRTDTDGKFLRAIRLAEADGTYRQKLETKYEHIWTAFWWFDDFQFLKDSYESFETSALQSDHALNLEFLCNLLQLFVNSVIHGHMSPTECKLEERTARLKEALEKIASNTERPNNALEAQTSLLIIRMNQIMLNDRRGDMASVWHDFSAVLEKAGGLGEFKAERLIQMVEIAGNIAGNDPSYNDLVEKMAEFVSRRTSEAEGALILLKRAQKLDFDNNFEMIRLLGKAAIGLTKKEYADDLIEALQLLMLAYRSAGLLWAARSSCIFLAGSLVMQGEEDRELAVGFIPTMKVWAWIALELRHLPDFLFAIQMLNGALASLPLTDESKARVQNDLMELDAALGSNFLNLEDADLQNLGAVPDILEALGLFMARNALLYTLGHMDVLRADGSIPTSETDADVNRLFSLLASQPVSDQLRGPLTLNSEDEQIFDTSILGMRVEIKVGSSINSILVAEAVLGSLEAFFATTIEQRIMPHTEKLHITLIDSDSATQPAFEINQLTMTGELIWPASYSLANYAQQEEIQKILMEVSGKVLATTCILGNEPKSFLKNLFVSEAVQHRMTMVAVTPNSYHRVASKSISRLPDWQSAVRKTYKLQDPRPTLTRVKFENQTIDEDDKKSANSQPPKIKDHRALNVLSIIDIHAWDQAVWRGTAYAQYDPFQPPCMAFLFENEEAARKIFERWQERFGKIDENEEISISIIRQLPQQNEYHYCVQIAPKMPETTDFKPKQIISVTSRCMVMEPTNDVNLENFLKSYSHFGAFHLMPAILSPGAPPDLLFDLAILKRRFSVKVAANVGEMDIEAIALRSVKAGK